MDEIKNERYAHCLNNRIQLLTRKHTWARKLKLKRKTRKYARGAENQEKHVNYLADTIHTHYSTKKLKHEA